MKASILLVEDDQFLHKLYKDMLIQEGYKVESAMDGKEAYEKIKNGGWDLVLLDVMLPGMDGFTIMNTLGKNNSFKKNFPVVYLTNLDNTKEINDIKKTADGYLVKSNLNPNEFLTEVKKYIK